MFLTGPHGLWHPLLSSWPISCALFAQRQMRSINWRQKDKEKKCKRVSGTQLAHETRFWHLARNRQLGLQNCWNSESLQKNQSVTKALNSLNLWKFAKKVEESNLFLDEKYLLLTSYSIASEGKRGISKEANIWSWHKCQKGTLVIKRHNFLDCCRREKQKSIKKLEIFWYLSSYLHIIFAFLYGFFIVDCPVNNQ